MWDAENRLTEVRQGPTTLASFTYDGFGRRQQKTASGVTHTYVSDQRSLIEERVSSGQTLRYVEGLDIDQHFARQDGAAVTYYVADHLGSVVQETNSTGAVSLARKYDPWGNLLAGGSSAGWSFTGREWDPEAGLYYYRARYYDPRPSRFTSEDPARFASGESNFYSYVQNSPIALVDPMGLAVGDTLEVPCNPWEMVQCRKRCGKLGMLSCTVTFTFKVTKVGPRDPDTGKTLYTLIEWVPGPMDCKCMPRKPGPVGIVRPGTLLCPLLAIDWCQVANANEHGKLTPLRA